MKFEYKTMKTKEGLPPPSAEQCSQAGLDGWELVWGYFNPGENVWYLYFKREI
jgi:hypothetical protein